MKITITAYYSDHINKIKCCFSSSPTGLNFHLLEIDAFKVMFFGWEGQEVIDFMLQG